MKSNLLLLLFCLLIQQAFGQVPQKFSFQGVARDASGKPVPNQTVNLRTSIRLGTVLGQAVYTETHSAQTSPTGVFNISIGGGATQSGQFDQIDWIGASYVLHVEMAIDGSTNYMNLGATQLLSVPYAVQAAKAEEAKEAEHAAVATEAGRWKNFDPIIQEGHFSKGSYLPEIDWTNNQKMMWFPRKAAFRFGAWSGDSKWTTTNIGDGSFAGGVNAVAAGSYSFAFGSSVTARETNAIAIGGNIQASYYSIALGHNIESEGSSSVALGNNLKSLGRRSVAIGYNLQSRSAYGAVFGIANDISDAVDEGPLQDSQRIFQIGNGEEASDGARRNAVTVLRNGNVGLGNNVLAPTHILDVGHRMRLRSNQGFTAGLWLDDADHVPYAFFGGYDNNNIGFYFENAGWRFRVNHQGNAELSGTLKQNSDIRLKKNITPLTVDFEKLSAISGRHYYWKDNTRSQALQTGLIAQEVEMVFPELVETDQEGYKSVNYIGLIPHLLEAVKELKNQNNELVATNSKLESHISAIESDRGNDSNDLQKRGTTFDLPIFIALLLFAMCVARHRFS